MTTLYVHRDDYFKGRSASTPWRRSPNAHPAYTNAEVLTLALLQNCFQVPTRKQTYRLVAANHKDAFPRLPSYSQWLARLHALTPFVGHLLEHLLPPPPNGVYLLDSKPIALCQEIRHGRVRLLRDEGAHFGKSSKGWFLGYKLHTLTHQDGTILCVFLAPANEHDHDYAAAARRPRTAKPHGEPSASTNYARAHGTRTPVQSRHNSIVLTKWRISFPQPIVRCRRDLLRYQREFLGVVYGAERVAGTLAGARCRWFASRLG